jgi:hypothetical protein
MEQFSSGNFWELPFEILAEHKRQKGKGHRREPVAFLHL